MREIDAYLREALAERTWVTEEQRRKAERLLAEGRLQIADIDRAVAELDARYFRVFDRKSNKREFFRIGQNVFPVGQKTELCVMCKYRHQEISGDYEVLVVPVYDYGYSVGKQYEDQPFIVRAVNNQLRIPVFFAQEQQYRVTVWKLDLQENRHLFVEFHVYALEQDLYRKQYLKGDLHCHTTYSDGFEPPELVVCAAKKNGCDFLAITDHNRYEGSVAAEKWVSKMAADITIIRGEEYSSFYTPLHILSLGAQQKLDPFLYSSGVLQDENGNPRLDVRIQAILDEKHEIDSEPLAYACVQFLLDRIRENGGLGIICHPLWKPLGYRGVRKDAPLNLVLDLVRHKRFDGIEIVSGSTLNDTHVGNLQHAITLKGLAPDEVAYVGITDSHGYDSDPIAGKHFTIVFADQNSADSILTAIREKRCVAVELNADGRPLCYGKLRYVMFAYFLIREYFPSRDQKAYQDGLRLEETLMI